MRVRSPRIVDLAGWVALTSAAMVLLREARAHGDPGILFLPILATASLLLLGRAAISAAFGPEAGRPVAAGVFLFGMTYLLMDGPSDIVSRPRDLLLPGRLVDAAIDANLGSSPNWVGRTATYLGFGQRAGRWSMFL